MEENMLEAWRRPVGRLCYWMAAFVLGLTAAGEGARATPPAQPQSGTPTTTIADTVYSASGAPAQGALIITWPAFVTATGNAVGAGSTNATLGTNGALNVALVANAGATPAGVYYTVVYQLQPGEVRTQYWVVPTSSTPVALAAVITTPGSGAATQPVSMQYVNSQLATVVHQAGAETITGVKTFNAPPNVPAPMNSGDVANKNYVDSAVSNVGAGNYLPLAGGAMSGPITLPANPAAPMQAANKQYVDTSLASKADLVTGLVPATELGSGVSSTGSCLLGNGASAAWGACGSGGGTGNVSTVPVSNQAIAQPEGTQFSTNNLANIRYVTSTFNWAQTPADNLTTPGNETIHLAPCPLGLDTASAANYYTYKVYISGKGTAEAVTVTGGSCVPGAASGTINVTTAYSHAAGYAVGSASTGIQEAWNDGWVSDQLELGSPYVKLTSNVIYNVYATVFLRGRGGVFDGSGAQIACYTRDRCLYLGTNQGHPYVHYVTLLNVFLNPAVLQSQQAWSNVASISASASAGTATFTVTTAAPHSFLVGDTVDCEYSTTGLAGHLAAPVVAAGYGTSQFEMQIAGNASFPAGAYTFGFCHILNAGIEDNSDGAVLENFQIAQASNAPWGVFTFAFVNDNDQHAVLNQPVNRGGSITLDNSYPVSAFVYQRTDQGFAGITYIEDAEINDVNCFTGGGNGMTMKNSVCQGFPTFGVRYFGALQPATIENVYQESTAGMNNALYGYPAAMGYLMQGGTGQRNVGTFPGGGFFPTFNCTGGAAETKRNYFVIPRSGGGAYGPMMYIGSSNASNCSGVSVPLLWPSVMGTDMTGASAGVVTYDVIWTSGTATPPLPGATANYVEINSTGVTCSASGMCSVSDPQTESTTYTLPTQGNFNPKLWFWPSTWALNNTVLFSDQSFTNPGIVSTTGLSAVANIAQQCGSAGAQEYRSQIIVTCLTPAVGPGAGLEAKLIRQFDGAGNGPLPNTKGWLNLGPSPGAGTDLITLGDSNTYKTYMTGGGRPSNDAGDMALGTDGSGGYAIRSPNSISAYINAIPSGTNFLERLTAAGKTFNVPVTVNGNFAVTGTTTFPITGSGNQCLHVSSTGVLSGTGADCGSGGGGSGTVNSGVASQVAMYAGNGTAVSGDSALTDNGTTLNYAGSGGIAATTGTFSGNLTVNGQLLVAGPWDVASPVPGTAMAAAGAGTSALGISNDGNFYISANAGTPQKIATTATSSYFSNLTQEDNYDVGQFVAGETTANPQALHVYSSYTNSSTWQRTSMGFDSADGYAVLRSENSAAGQAPGLGFWINNGLKWVIDQGSNLKPWADMASNIGSFSGTSGIGLRPATIYVGGSSSSNSGFELGKFANNSYEICNDTATGTVLNGLAALTMDTISGTATACAIKPTSAVTTGVIGVVVANAGTSGTATLVRTGSAYCSFDTTPTVVGDYVVASSVNGSYFACHDAGATLPSGMQILGRVLQATGGGTTAQMFFDMPGSGRGPATVSSVFGRTGAVTAASGDYSVGQVTGAAATASPTFTGTVTEPDGTTNTSSGYTFAHALTLPSGSAATTQAAGDNSTKVATTAYVRSEQYLTFSCPLGSVGTMEQFCTWTLPAGITVTGFDLTAGTAPVGCTTSAVVQVWDGTANVEVGSYSITLSNGNNFYTQVTGSANVASGHALRVKTTTGEAGCSTTGANVVAVVTYQMQG